MTVKSPETLALAPATLRPSTALPGGVRLVPIRDQAGTVTEMQFARMQSGG